LTTIEEDEKSYREYSVQIRQLKKSHIIRVWAPNRKEARYIANVAVKRYSICEQKEFDIDPKRYFSMCVI
jgi:hypothetical protein